MDLITPTIKNAGHLVSLLERRSVSGERRAPRGTGAEERPPSTCQSSLRQLALPGRSDREANCKWEVQTYLLRLNHRHILDTYLDPGDTSLAHLVDAPSQVFKRQERELGSVSSCLAAIDLSRVPVTSPSIAGQSQGAGAEERAWTRTIVVGCKRIHAGNAPL